MKLLRNEAEYFAWMRRSLDDDATDEELRVYAPTAYPAYAYWDAVPEDDPELLFLYYSDCETMAQALFELISSGSPAQETL